MYAVESVDKKIIDVKLQLSILCDRAERSPSSAAEAIATLADVKSFIESEVAVKKAEQSNVEDIICTIQNCVKVSNTAVLILIYYNTPL